MTDTRLASGRSFGTQRDMGQTLASLRQTRIPRTGCYGPRPQQVSADVTSNQRAQPVVCAATSLERDWKDWPELYPLDGVQYEEDHTYSPLANWLIPGRVLVGRYPYVEPSRCSSREVGEQQIKQLLQTGVTSFVCLQAELPPQKGLRIGGEDGFLPYMPVATMLSSSLSGPPDVSLRSGIRNNHLDQFLPTKRRASGDASSAGADPCSRLDFLHCPIPDLGIPTADQVRELIVQLVEKLRQGEVLYIHCWGGRGRAGIIGACLLATVYGIHSSEALRRVQKAFNSRGDDVGRWSPETMEQREFVRKYIANLRREA